MDLSTLPSFRQALREAQLSASTVSIDLRDLEFIDCAGLGAIFDARRDGNMLVLERGFGQVARVLALAGLPERIEDVDLQQRPVALGDQRIGTPNRL